MKNERETSLLIFREGLVDDEKEVDRLVKKVSDLLTDILEDKIDKLTIEAVR